MSTLPGVASKGEKSKQKFQSLDINSLYRVSRGENLEKQQQKNTFTYKHGMQSLGKVPNARRAPANLPSLKSEHSGSDASVPLVPPGGPGWGKQDAAPTTGTSSSTSSPTAVTTTASAAAAAVSTPSSNTNTVQPSPPQLSSHQAAIALPVTTTIPPASASGKQQQQQQQQPSSATPATGDKSWSAVMSGPDPIHPPLYQSQQFQHEFPSLSVGDGGPTRTGSDAAGPYAPGLSLRPQTEGSWIQGGSRPDGGPPRSSSAPLGGPPQLAAPAGLPQQPLPPQFRTVMPTFMYKGSFPAGSAGVPNQTAPSINNNSGNNSSSNSRRQQQPPRMVDSEEITPRPIIKEEELSRMDEIDKDMGWTCHDEIDYNQKLAFSDDESSSNDKQQQHSRREKTNSNSSSLEKTENSHHHHHHHHHHLHQQNEQIQQVSQSQRGWNNTNSVQPPQNRQQQQQRPSDEEVWKQRRSQHNKNLELTVQRAKQRKEEEEKRFNEATKQGAAKKLMELEEKMNKRSREEEGAGTINPSVVPAKPIVPADIPLPDFQRDKERSRTPNEPLPTSMPNEEKQSSCTNSTTSFRQLTQIEGKNFAQQQQQQRSGSKRGGSEHVKSSERERDREIREQNGPSFSRHFQNQLPPRFQKQRNNSSNSNGNGGSGSNSVQFQHHSLESAGGGRWMQQQQQQDSRKGSPEREREDDQRDYKRQSSEDSHRGGSHKSERFDDGGHHEYSSARHAAASDYDYSATTRRSGGEKEKSEEWHSSSSERYREGRPQRPDSRDSRASRDSRHSRDSAEPREYVGAWADGGSGGGLEPTYEEKRKDHGGGRVPGPITKDRIEADDLRSSSEKRNLTQLKRGQLPLEKKMGGEKKENDKMIHEENELLMLGGKPHQHHHHHHHHQHDILLDTNSWADQSMMLMMGQDQDKFVDIFDKSSKMNDGSKEGNEKKSDKSDSEFKDKDEKRNLSRSRNYQQNSSSGGGGKGGWGGGEYHRSGGGGGGGGGGWPKRQAPNSGQSQRGQQQHRQQFHTDSEEGSMDEVNSSGEQLLAATHKSPKSSRKFDKDTSNKEIKHDKHSMMMTMVSNKMEKDGVNAKREGYVPRGEPSRHGRGGSGGGSGNFRGGGSSGRGGLSKRIDGYGPPPSKSPFGHHEDKKLSSDENSNDASLMLHTGGSFDDRANKNQQALSAGISVRKEYAKSGDDSKLKGGRKQPDRRGKSKTKDDPLDSNSDNSDDKDGKTIRKPSAAGGCFGSIKSNHALGGRGAVGGSAGGSGGRRANPPPPPRLSTSDKKAYGSSSVPRQNSSGTLRNSKKDDLIMGDASARNKENDGGIGGEDEEKASLCGGDSDGFQEVKSKKTGKERQKSQEDAKLSKLSTSAAAPIGSKLEKDAKSALLSDRKPKASNSSSSCSSAASGGGVQLTQQQISNIPPLMATPVNPPPVLPQMSSNSNSSSSNNKTQFERPRQNKLAPRFAKQREVNRLQKVQMQQQNNICDVVSDMNKVNQSLNVYGIKDTAPGSVVVAAPLVANVWDKSSTTSASVGLSQQLRGIDNESVLVGGVVGSDKTSSSSSIIDQSGSNSSPSSNDSKLIGKGQQLQDKAMLDGTTPPMNTIIFENTNFKSAPGARSSSGKPPPPRSKLDDQSSLGDVSFAKPLDLLCKSSDGKQQQQSDAIQIALPSFKEDSGDIKLDFFGSELSHLTDEKSSTTTTTTSGGGGAASKGLCMPRSMHVDGGTCSSTISTADALNFKIQSVKKMWETPAPVDHVGGDDATASFASSFVTDPSALDAASAFVKGAAGGNDGGVDDGHEGYSPSPNQVANNTTNVCKVKPTQQVSGGGGASVGVQAVHQQQQQQHVAVGMGLMGNPLSPPPPLPAVIGQPPQQYTASQHLGYQTAGLGGSSQYGISAIPSPPTVMYNSTQQQLQQTAAGLYGAAFQIDQSGVLGGQAARSQYSQYYGLGQTASSPYSTQSVYLQTQPHPPPPAAQAPPPDLYQNISNYRMSATGPFGQNQQLNNPTTVLISSTSNSLMSASVKPSGQQISAIGTKAGGVGQAYQQQSQQSQQVYAMYEPSLQANYLPSAAGVMQRGPPTGPVQNNVVPALQPSSSYYSGSTGQTGYFQQPGSSTIQSAQLQQHQAGYGLQGNVFGTPHNQSHTNAGLQSFNSHFLSTPMQIAAALNHQQQYRTQQYMKGVGGGQQMNDQGGRSQQLKSPSSQEVLCSVFNSGSQISSPKLRQNCKQPPPQPSPTAQHKYNLYQGVGSQQSANMQRYPTPIQRPINFQVNLGALQQQQQQQNNTNNSNNNPKQHRANNNANNKVPSRQYYQSNSISSQNEKIDDSHSKLSNDGSNSTNHSAVANSNKAVIGGGGGGGGGPTGSSATANAVNSSASDKDAINIEETSALKD